MKVEATKLGYYKHKRRKEGEVFFLEDIKVKGRGKDKKVFVVPAEAQFAESWMKLLDAKAIPASDEEDDEPAALVQTKVGRQRTAAPDAAKEA